MPAYPGRIIKQNEADPAIVRELADALRAKGQSPTSPDGVFDAAFKAQIKLYQSLHTDNMGNRLEEDGKVGSLTWGSLFGPAAAAAPAAPTGEGGAALALAIGQIGVMEQPISSNRGPQVDAYQRTAGLGVPPGNYWCMAFVYWCFHEAGQGATAFPRTGGCLDAWNKVKSASPQRILTRAAALANPALVKPGMVFILDHGGGLGHTGFVRASLSGALTTVEGNTNNDGSNNGIGVFELKRRKVIDASLKGFLDFT
ncbi:MAG TPA: CHAP domain-containing protein [Novosphingobium sp.]|nr:CHAP domain-containing protein [Novosphingobium sp.]